jgi:hypothetical protein
MATDNITGKPGPKFTIELPPPIPTRSKEKGNVQQVAARSQKVNTEKISESPSSKGTAAPPPIPTRTEPKVTTGTPSARENKGKTARIAKPPSGEGSQNTSRRVSSSSTGTDAPVPINRSLVAIVLLLAGFVAFVMIVSIKATTSSNPSPAAYSPASSTAQESDTAAPAPQAATQASDTAVETPSPSPASPNTTPDVSTAASDTKIKENDRQAQAKFQEGYDAAQQGIYYKSYAAYQEALKLKPDYPEAWSNIGWNYLQEGVIPQAISAYQRAVALNPDLADAWNGLAICYAKSQDAESANSAVRSLERRDSGRAKQLLCSFSTDFLCKIAVARYPSLGVLDTPMNLEYRRRHDYYKANLPSYFSSPDWPLSLAKEVYESMDPTLRDGNQSAPLVPGLSQ